MFNMQKKLQLSQIIYIFQLFIQKIKRNWGLIVLIVRSVSERFIIGLLLLLLLVIGV